MGIYPLDPLVNFQGAQKDLTGLTLKTITTFLIYSNWSVRLHAPALFPASKKPTPYFLLPNVEVSQI